MLAPKEDIGLKVGEKAPDFSLQDAYGKTYQLSKLKSELIILIFGNRKTRKEADKWALAVKEGFKEELEKSERLTALQVGDVSGKPFFITRSFVIRWLKRKKTILPMPLDWDGKIFKMYKAPKDRPMLYLIHGGKIVWKTASKLDKRRFEELKKAIKSPRRTTDMRNKRIRGGESCEGQSG
jgi:peroxiredoxin